MFKGMQIIGELQIFGSHKYAVALLTFIQFDLVIQNV